MTLVARKDILFSLLVVIGACNEAGRLPNPVDPSEDEPGVGEPTGRGGQGGRASSAPMGTGGSVGSGGAGGMGSGGTPANGGSGGGAGGGAGGSDAGASPMRPADAGSMNQGGTGGQAPSAPVGSGATDPNLKVAFIGDTAHGTNYADVLKLVKSEGAQAVVVAGDMTYGANPTAWWDATDAVVGKDFPVFIARGNHDDSSWAGFGPRQKDHLGGAQRTAGPHDAAHRTLWKGLSLLTIRKGDRGAVIKDLAKDDKQIWKVCVWHQNMNKLQVGGKGDEMGYDTYEACRELGAIIINGHEHTYHRTKTLTSFTSQTVDATCADGAKLCVRPGRTFLAVSGVGGTGLRNQVRCLPTAPMAPFPSLSSDPTCKIWASIYTKNQGANYGAQFMVFNVEGDPKRAKGYFKDIKGQTVDTFEVRAE